MFELNAYLQRILLSATPLANEDGFRQLHEAQAFTVPFENIDPFLSRPVRLDLSSLSDKILHRGRGGYCFELNSLFLHALKAFGFEAHAALGRVFMGKPEPGGRTHQVSLVKIGKRTWLADVGFGGPGLVHPIPFEAGYEEVQQGRRIRLRRDDQWGMMYEEELATGWRILYSLPGEEAIPVDFVIGNHYCSTHPDSIFTRSLNCALHEATKKITILDRIVHVYEDEQKSEYILGSQSDLSFWFRENMRLKLDEADIRALAQKLF